MVEVGAGVAPVEAGLAVALVFEAQVGAGVFVDVVAKEQVVFGENMAGESVGGQHSEHVLSLSDHRPVVPGVAVLAVSAVVDFEPVVRVAGIAEMRGAEPETDVFERFGSIKSGVKIPPPAPVVGDPVVEQHLEVVVGFDLGEERPALREIEPQLGLVAGGEAALVLADRHLEVHAAFCTLGIELGHEELLVHEVVPDEVVGQPGEISPGIDFY